MEAVKGDIPLEAVTNELWAYSTQGRKQLHVAGCCVIMQRKALSKGQFRFFLTYCSCSRNTIPDALSRLFSPNRSRSEPSSILLPSCIMGAATWRPNRLHRVRVTGLPTVSLFLTRSGLMSCCGGILHSSAHLPSWSH